MIQNYCLISRTVYLLIELFGSSRSQDARTSRKIFFRPARPHSVNLILSYDHFSFFIFIFLVKRGHARGSIAFRAHFQRTNKQRCELVIEAFRRPTVHRDNITVRMFAFTRFQENTL